MYKIHNLKRTIYIIKIETHYYTEEYLADPKNE